MFETLFGKNPALLIPIVALLGATVVFTVWIIAHYWHGIRRQELEASLKQDMLNRGFGAEEIERVLVSTSARQEAPESPETVTDNEYYLVEKMLEEGHTIEDIERLVRAFKQAKDASAIRLPNRAEA
jgi:hypothetical protein